MTSDITHLRQQLIAFQELRKHAARKDRVDQCIHAITEELDLKDPQKRLPS